jgi:hypothetical protein
MRIAQVDLNLVHLFVVHPRSGRMSLAKGIDSIGVGDLRSALSIKGDG